MKIKWTHYHEKNMVTSRSKYISLCMAVIALLISTSALAQYKIELSKNENSNVTKSIYKGYKITYKVDGKPLTTSRIKEISPDFIITAVDTFQLSELDFIGYQKPLSQIMKFGAQLTYYGSFGMLVLAYFAYTRLPLIPEIGTILAVMGFVPLIISRRIIRKSDYALFDLHYQWEAKVVLR